MTAVYFRFAAHGSDAFERSPLLERLVARAAPSVRVTDWRAEAFRCIAPDGVLPPLAAPLFETAEVREPGAWACLATPVELIAGTSHVTMPAHGILTLTRDEANSLAIDFSAIFAGAGVRLVVRRSLYLLCVFDDLLEVTTHDPDAAAGHDVFGFQPTGIDAGRLRRLMSEIEMWLFEHEVNRTRAREKRAPVSHLWLWGGGRLGERVAAVHGFTHGEDPFFAAFGNEEHYPDGAAGGVVVTALGPASSSWGDVEQGWLAPAVGSLEAGRITRLDLCAGSRRVSVGRWAKLRSWRRRRPWWQSFPIEGVEEE